VKATKIALPDKASARRWRRQFQALSPPTERGVVGHRQVEAEQLEDRADQSLGLAQRQTEHTARNVKAVVIARSE
jgi:hypothetical protein